MMMRLLTFAFAVAAAHDYAADVDGTGQDSKNETLDDVDDEDTFLDIAKLLLLAGADCDRATIPHGGTAAIYAVLDRKYTALGALGLSGRCDMDKADAGGKTPADWARRSNDENALYVLREAKPETAYGRNIFQAKPEKPEP